MFHVFCIAIISVLFSSDRNSFIIQALISNGSLKTTGFQVGVPQQSFGATSPDVWVGIFPRPGQFPTSGNGIPFRLSPSRPFSHHPGYVFA